VNLLLKALGIVIDKGLTWRSHITLLKKRVMKVVGGVRIVRNKLTESQTTTIVTAQLFPSSTMRVAFG